MTKKETDDLSNDMLMADALLRLKTMENLLLAKGIFTKEEYSAEMESITRQITKTLLEKANVTGDLDALIDSLGKLDN